MMPNETGKSNRSPYRSGLKLDYKTPHSYSSTANYSSHQTGHSHKGLFKRYATNTPAQGAVRIDATTPKPSKSTPLRKRVALIALLFIGVIFATIGNEYDDNKVPSPISKLLANTKVKPPSGNTPDFYFIEDSHFVPGSNRLANATLPDWVNSESDESTSEDLVVAIASPELNQSDNDNNELENSNTTNSLQQFDKSEDTQASNPTTTQQTLVVVKSGDTLSQILENQGLGRQLLLDFLALKNIKKHLSMLKLKQKFTFTHHEDGTFESFSTRIASDKKLLISNNSGNLQSDVFNLPIIRKIDIKQATIESSLAIAGQDAGLSQKIIMNIVDIFQWDVDFSLDIRKGDSFKVIYEKLYRSGELIGEGDILAAEFVHSGRSIKAIRYTDPTGRTSYYTPEGRSMRKAFLRNPVDLVRITSHFNLKRKHPVLHTIRAHKGTDYGAPRGTPIRSTGDGKVIFSGRKGAYGKTVVLKHGRIYTTLYAHMSKIAKGLRAGKQVNQGQIIGYVGSTGRVTGAHLHYEFKIRGKHKNPLKVKLPGTKPLSKKYRRDFNKKSNELIAILDRTQSSPVASR